MRINTTTTVSQQAPLALGVEDAARALGIGRTLAFALIREGQLQAIRIGGRTLVTIAECERLLARLALGK